MNRAPTRFFAAAIVALATAAAGAQTFCRPLQIEAPDGFNNDYHGNSVDIDGDTLVAGAPGCLSCVTQTGAAYVYTRDGIGWAFQAKLLKPDPQPGDRFGTLVRINGDTAIVAASRDDNKNGENAGSVDVYVRDGTQWSHQATLFPPVGTPNISFSGAEIDGDTIILSHGDAASFLGSVYVYTRENGVWSLQETLLPPDFTQTGVWGDSISISGDTIVVGASATNTAGVVDSGGADIFVRDNGVWAHLQRIGPNDPETEGLVGQIVRIHGDTIALGAPRLDDRNGALYIFQHNGTDWSFSQKLDPPVPAFNPQMGSAVSIDDDYLVTRSDRKTVVYEPNNGTYTLEAYLDGFDDLESPVVHQGRTFVTAHLTNGPSFASIPGAILYYTVPDSMWECCTGDCDLSGGIDFNDLVSILFDFGSIGQPWCDADADGAIDFNDLITALFLFGPCD